MNTTTKTKPGKVDKKEDARTAGQTQALILAFPIDIEVVDPSGTRPECGR